MDHFVISILYLLIFRLAIVVTGVICIKLGFKLFTLGISSGTDGAVSDINAQIGGTKFSFKKIAPGSGFALFGVLLISSMVLQSAPAAEFRQTLHGMDTISDSNGKNSTDTISEIILKGQRKSTRIIATDSAVSLLSAGDTAGAVSVFMENIVLSVPSLNALAWIYLKQGNIDSAFPFSVAAVAAQPDNADYHHTMAEIYRAKNDTLLYREQISIAAKLNRSKYVQ